MKIEVVAPEAIPLDLLLSADPSEDNVRAHLRRSVAFAGTEAGRIVAAALLELRGEAAELHAIAVAADRQGHGLGRELLAQVLAHAARAGIGRVEVGTGNSSLRQLAFYQRSGFRVVGVIPDFFAAYRPPIIEDGIPCRDMIRLACTPPEPPANPQPAGS